MFKHELFKSIEFEEYATALANIIASKPPPGELLIQQLCPAIAESISNLHQHNNQQMTKMQTEMTHMQKEMKGMVDEVKEVAVKSHNLLVTMISVTSNVFSALNRQINGQVPFISRFFLPFSSTKSL